MSSDDGITVSGGAGGTKACLIALVTASVRAGRAAQGCADAADRAMHAADLVDRTAALSPATAAPARESVAGLVTGPHGLLQRSERLQELADGLRSAAEAYARADLDAAAVLASVVQAAGRGLGELGPLGGVIAGVAGVTSLVWAGEATLWARIVRYTPTPAGWAIRQLGSESNQADDGPLGALARLVGGPGLVPEIPMPSPDQVQAALPFIASMVLGLAPGRAPAVGDPVTTVAAMTSVVARAGVRLFGRPLPGLLVAPLVQRRGATGEDVPPQTVADVLREVDSVAGDTTGAVGVQRVDHVDGTRSWVVSIPGTQDGGVGGSTTTDMESNLELMAGLPDDRTETVLRAMEQSGVRPDEPVLLAGHSQGGMAAVRVAESVGDHYTIAGVVTAGSPVGGMALPADVPALHLEHAQDYVPATDSLPNPDEPNRTTVTRDLAAAGPWPPVAVTGDVGSFFVAPHDLTEYIRTAELVAWHPDRSVTTFLDAIAPVLDDGTATVTTTRYVGVRVPDDASDLTGIGSLLPASATVPGVPTPVAPTSSCGTSR